MRHTELIGSGTAVNAKDVAEFFIPIFKKISENGGMFTYWQKGDTERSDRLEYGTEAERLVYKTFQKSDNALINLCWNKVSIDNFKNFSSDRNAYFGDFTVDNGIDGTFARVDLKVAAITKQYKEPLCGEIDRKSVYKFDHTEGNNFYVCVSADFKRFNVVDAHILEEVLEYYEKERPKALGEPEFKFLHTSDCITSYTKGNELYRIYDIINDAKMLDIEGDALIHIELQ